MHIHYSQSPHDVLGPAQELLPMFKHAGVDHIWLWGTFSGRGIATPQEMVAAYKVLQQFGFESGVSSVPVGHPGNSLNPEDESLDLRLPAHWRYRVDRHGQNVYFCGDISPEMVHDNVEAVRTLRDHGFRQFFMDDDLRQGNWGREIQGCFCASCLAEFSQRQGRAVAREELSQAIERLDQPELLSAWVHYQCERVTEFVRALALPGVDLGVMVMHAGDERHGLDLPALRRAVPGCLIRVGEAHFSEDDYGSPAGKASELSGVLQHLGLVGRERSYSETTIFPPRALQPRSWVHKMKLALAAGIPNLFFMGGTWTIEANYWEAEMAALPGLRALENRSATLPRLYPVHVVNGTHGSGGERIVPPAAAFLAGLPATSLRGDQTAAENYQPGELLLWFGEYELTPAWRAALPAYRWVIADAAALARNPELAASPNVHAWPALAGDQVSEGSLAELRALVARSAPDYPWLVAGQDVSLFWLGDSVLLLNQADAPAHVVLAYSGTQQAYDLPPLGLAWLPLGASVEQPVVV